MLHSRERDHIIFEEQRTKSKEQRAKSKEQRAKSKEQRAKSKEQRAKSKEQRAKSKDLVISEDAYGIFKGQQAKTQRTDQKVV